MSSQELIRLLQHTRNLLAFHQELGLGDYPRTPGVDGFLGGPNGPSSRLEAPMPPGARPGMTGSPRPRPAKEPQPTLDELRREAAACRACPLHAGRQGIVRSEGECASGLMIIGDPPGAGRPFTGEADELLTRMLQAIDLARDTVYVTAALKCVPPPDRAASPAELKTCLGLLRREIAAASPRVLCTMGPTAAQILLGSPELFKLRGRFHQYHRLPLMPTFHPEFLIANREMKKAAWLDLQAIQKRLRQPA